MLYHFGAHNAPVSVAVDGGRWRKVLDSSDAAWMGPGSEIPAELIADGGALVLNLTPHSVCVLGKVAD